MTGFGVDAAGLAERAARFAGVAEQVAAIHRDLADQLAAAGQCWGTDDVGLGFSAIHAAPADETLTALGGLPARLTEVGERLTDNAAAYTLGESDNVRRIER